MGRNVHGDSAEDDGSDEIRQHAEVLGSGMVVQGGRDAHVTVHNFTAHPTGPARSFYREQVAQIAPEHLRDREAELAELAAFCTDPAEDAPAYLWWRAPKWSGKTALMATFVLHPPEEVRVVAFFVTARWAGHDTRAAFVDIVGDQLAEILDEPGLTGLPGHVRDGYFTGLLARAARACRDRGERLVLLVDGLDEDRGTPHDHPAGQGNSIAAILPARPEAGLRVAVSARPNPALPADVPAGHPLRSPTVLRLLEGSPHAEVARDQMLLELNRLLGGGPEQQDLPGLITAARGGLTEDDLAELTGQPRVDLNWRLRTAAARTLDTRAGQWRRNTRVHLLGHEDLQATAAEKLGEQRLGEYRQRLHDWAEHYRELGWPPHTPEYLLHGYHRMLADIGDLPRMAALATDSARHNRMRTVSGGDTAALTEIALTQDRVAEHDQPDLTALMRMAIHRDHLHHRNRDIPVALPAAWVRCGEVDRAEAVADSIPDVPRRAEAMAKMAAELARIGDVRRATALIDHADAVAHTITSPAWRARVLIGMVEATLAVDVPRKTAMLIDHAETAAQQAVADRPDDVDVLGRVAEVSARAGDLRRAERIAEAVTEYRWRGLVWVAIAEEVARTGDRQRATTLVDRVVANTRSDRRLRWTEADSVLTHLAVAAVRMGDLRRAERIAGSIHDNLMLARGWTKVVVEVALTGDLQWAAVLLGRVEAAVRRGLSSSEYESAELLVDVAEAVAQAGDPRWAGALVDRAEAIARRPAEHDRRLDYKWQIGALTAVMEMVARTGDSRRTGELIDCAVAAAQAVLDSDRYEWGWLRTLEAVARVDLDRAESIARAVSDSHVRCSSLIAVAKVAAQADKPARAGDIIGTLSAPDRDFGVMAEVAKAVARAGDPNQAEVVARVLPDGEERTRVMAEVARAAALAGDPDRAVRILRELPDHTLKMWALANVAEAVARAGDSHRAVTLVQHIRTTFLWYGSSELRYSVKPVMVRAAVLAGDLRLAMDIAHQGDSWRPRGLALITVAEAVARAGDLQHAATLVDEVEAKTLACDKPDDRVMAGLAGVVAWLGDLSRAERLARTISAPSWRSAVLAEVAGATARAGDSRRASMLADEAEAIAQAMITLEQRGQALVEMAQSWCGREDGAHPIGRHQRWLAQGLRLIGWQSCLRVLAWIMPELILGLVRELEALDWIPGPGEPPPGSP